jgi:hypothetical protein
VRGHGRDADAGAELKVRASREREDAVGGDDGELLGGAARRTAVAGQGDPDAIALTEAGDPGADRVDHAGAVVVGNRRLVSAPPKVPLRDFQSVGFTPDTSTRIRTSPAPGSGIGCSTSSSTDGSPGRV